MDTSGAPPQKKQRNDDAGTATGTEDDNNLPTGRFVAVLLAGKDDEAPIAQLAANMSTHDIGLQLAGVSRSLRDALRATFARWTKSNQRFAVAIAEREKKARAGPEAKRDAALAALGREPTRWNGRFRDDYAFRAARDGWNKRMAACHKACNDEVRANLDAAPQRSPNLPDLPAGLVMRCLAPWAAHRRPPFSRIAEIHLPKKSEAGGNSLRCWRITETPLGIRAATKETATFATAQAHIDAIKDQEWYKTAFAQMSYSHPPLPSSKLNESGNWGHYSDPRIFRTRFAKIWTTGYTENIHEAQDDYDRFAGEKVVGNTFVGHLLRNVPLDAIFSTTKAVRLGRKGNKPGLSHLYDRQGMREECGVAGCTAAVYVVTDDRRTDWYDTVGLLPALKAIDIFEKVLAMSTDIDAHDCTLRCCKKGHLVGTACVRLTMVGHLGWRKASSY